MTLRQQRTVLLAASAHSGAGDYVPTDAALIPVFAATWLLLDTRGKLAPIDRADLLDAGVGPGTCAEVAALVGVVVDASGDIDSANRAM